MTKSQVDRLGERLKKGEIADADLRALDEYRRSFSQAYEQVVEALRSSLGFEPTGRPAKSTPSIVEKLRRESIRLSQIQDIAGCRIVVKDILAQDAAVDRLRNQFSDVSVSDRRTKSSHGYRAVHVIAVFDGKWVEIQIRTMLQHGWAQVSEKLADAEDAAIKYGGGPAWAQKVLQISSEGIKGIEVEEKMGAAGEFMAQLKAEMLQLFERTIEWAEGRTKK